MNALKDARILLIDDQQANLDLLEVFLQDAGYLNLRATRNPLETTKLLADFRPDLILLDLHMPHMDGYQVLQTIRPLIPEDDYLPVLVLTADASRPACQRALELGANDFLTKPLDETETLLRIGNLLKTRLLHLSLKDRNQALGTALQDLATEREKSERLIAHMIPPAIAGRLKNSTTSIADSFDEATVLFADIEGFSGICERTTPEHLVSWLNALFSMIDQLALDHGLEKIKTIGDAYMVVGGIPSPRHDHVEAVADLALRLRDSVAEWKAPSGDVLKMRIGIHTGKVVAGVIGSQKLTYDLWGDTVNMASRMQSHGVGGGIHVTSDIRDRLHDRYEFAERGDLPIKNKGSLTTYLLLHRR